MVNTELYQIVFMNLILNLQFLAALLVDANANHPRDQHAVFVRVYTTLIRPVTSHSLL